MYIVCSCSCICICVRQKNALGNELQSCKYGSIERYEVRAFIYCGMIILNKSYISIYINNYIYRHIYRCSCGYRIPFFAFVEWEEMGKSKAFNFTFFFLQLWLAQDAANPTNNTWVLQMLLNPFFFLLKKKRKEKKN